MFNNVQQARMWKEMIIVYFRNLSRQFVGQTKENNEKSHLANP
jgi:hypothetical protein